MLGDVHGRSVLDIGCQDPDLARFVLAGQPRGYLGLATGEDQAEQLTGTAAQVRVQDLGRWSGAGDGVFDLAIAAMTLHRVRNLARLLETLHRHAVSGGRLVFSVDLPLATAQVSGYFEEGERLAPDVNGRTSVIWHRTLGSYVHELRYCGFQLAELSESRTGVAPGWRCSGRPNPLTTR